VRNTYVVAGRARRKRILKDARGYRGNRSKNFRNAVEQVRRARVFSFVGRKLKKRDFRALWILRINASCRARGINYSQFMNGLKKAGVELDRKQLSELSLHFPGEFDKIVELAQTKLAS
jgi:large subunit ribosomal protein L20